MATERQIRANRANALKSTGPITPEGKRISSQNASLQHLLSHAAPPEGESLDQYNQLAAALTHQFQPRDPAETALVQTMTLTRWHLSNLWGTQTAALQRERARQNRRRAATGFPTAAAFLTLANNSRAFTRQLRLEAFCSRQYHQALAQLLKMRDPNQPQEMALADFKTEANLIAAQSHFTAASDS